MAVEKKWIDRALLLAVITVFYNIAEGVVSMWFGFSDETLSLFGFGVDSFIEVMSGLGIWHLVVRIRRNDNRNEDRFEKTALRITGIAFFILAAGLVVTVVFNVVTGHRPETTFWGIVISSISILTMGFLYAAKRRVGKELGSDAIIADANCTKTCIYLSVVLLVASILFQVFHIGYIDSIAALVIAWYALSEGREAIEMSEGKACSCGSCH